jgi:hypothetical protein
MANRSWPRDRSGPVKILHAGLLLQSPPPTSTSKEHTRLLRRGVLAPTGRLRPKPRDIVSTVLKSKEPASERRGVVKFVHVGLLLIKLPGASSRKEQVAVRGRHRSAARYWPTDCRSGPWWR